MMKTGIHGIPDLNSCFMFVVICVSFDQLSCLGSGHWEVINVPSIDVAGALRATRHARCNTMDLS